MRLVLDELGAIHHALRGHPTDLAKCGALALQRAGHASPVQAATEHDGIAANAEIEWSHQDAALLGVLDKRRITEDGAEAIALSFANCQAGWIVKRRLQRGEFADWLLQKESKWLALEVSGTTGVDGPARLLEKKQQVARCSLPVERLAIVVSFTEPSILAGSA